MSTDLLNTFWIAVVNFNQQNWPPLVALLDERVAMKRIDDPGYHVGKADVIAYFHGHGQHDRAVFTPTEVHHQVTGKFGLIWGTADWKNLAGSAPRNMVFSFVFVRHDNGNWLELNLWAALL